jgi:hypothetical protein
METPAWELTEALSGGNHRKKAARMVPGYAGKFYHGFEDDGFTVLQHPMRMIWLLREVGEWGFRRSESTPETE